MKTIGRLLLPFRRYALSHSRYARGRAARGCGWEPALSSICVHLCSSVVREPMAKFPTQVEASITVKAPLDRAYKYLWDVVGSAKCIPGLASCKRVGDDTYRFTYK